MTPALRKNHRRAWFFLAAFLPALFVAAVLAIPERVADPGFDDRQPAALEEVLKSAQSEQFDVRLRANRTVEAFQLEVFVKKPLAVPSVLVYLSGSPDARWDESQLVGSLSSVGAHRFPLGSGTPPDTCHFQFFDPVKNKVIEKMRI